MFSKRLKILRKQKKITQADLAKVIHLTQSTVAGYENGSKTPTLDTLLLLAQYFNVSCDYLIGFNNNKGTITKASSKTNDNELKLLEYYRLLDEKEQSMIIGDIAHIILDKRTGKSAKKKIINLKNQLVDNLSTS